MRLNSIDSGKEFDFGRTSADYAQYRDIYPDSMYQKLIAFGVIKSGYNVLDLGSGTCVLPIRLADTGASFTATDISENQVDFGRKRVAALGFDNISFKTCSAENTGFNDSTFDSVTAVQCFHYFDPDKATDEIYRVLKPGCVFCKIFMDWLPLKDEKVAEMEQLVLKYNPNWSGCGFEKFRYKYPDWADNKFEIETIHSYDAVLEFTIENWIGRIKSCRGIGASLSADKVSEFEKEYRDILKEYNEPLRLLHQIHIEIYRSEKKR